MIPKDEFPYNQQHMTIEDLQLRLLIKGDPIGVARVMDAYTMARNVHEFQTRNDDTPYFYHCTRVCRIVMDEVEIFDSDVLAACLLHDVLEDSDSITRGVLEYNFGSYVAYLVETLTKDLDKARKSPDEVDIEHAQRLANASEDCLLIRLTARLDNIRCLDYSLKRNPHLYIQNTFKRYLPLADKSPNRHLKSLANEIRLAANKFLG